MQLYKPKWLVYAIVIQIIALFAPAFLSAAERGTPEKAFYSSLEPDQFMTRWLVLGPIPVFAGKANPEDQDAQKAVFASEFITVKQAKDAAKRGTVTIKGQKLSWQPIQVETGTIDLLKTYGDAEYVVAYAWAELELAAAKNALMGVGSDDGVKIWLNGELVHENWIGRPVREDDDLVEMMFKKGRNQLLFKVQNMGQAWGFSCRMIGPTLFPEKMINFAAKGDLDALKLLLTYGADANATFGPGVTALHTAKIYGRKEAIELLVKHGADPKLPMPAPEQMVDAYIGHTITDKTPGMAILVAQNGQILYQKGYGLASMEHQVPVTTETKFRIGSVTKQFTGAAILKLQEAGKLKVTDTLSKYLPDFPRANEVTLHHLLTHTSGIHSYTNEPDFMKSAPVEVKPEELIREIEKDTFDFNPGEKWSYNNSGFVILGYIIEKVSGQSFGDYLATQFFRPLAMPNTGVHASNLILAHEATGYAWDNGKWQKALNWDMTRHGGAGALYSTIGDLYRWNEAVFNGQALSEASLTAAFTPVALNDGNTRVMGTAGYGYGWSLGEFRGLKEIQHGGGLHGFGTFLTRFPEQNFTVAVVMNSLPTPPNINVSNVAHEIVQVYLWEKMADLASYAVDTSVNPELFEAYVGRYEYPGGAILTVTREGKRLFAQMTGQGKFELFPSSATEFFWKVVDARIQFVKDEAGQVTHALHFQGGQELNVPKLKEIEAVQVDPALLDGYLGDYELAPGAILTVTREAARLFAQLTGQPKFEIFPKSETVFFYQVVSAEITFVKAETGVVSHLILNQAGQVIKAKKIK